MRAHPSRRARTWRRRPDFAARSGRRGAPQNGGSPGRQRPRAFAVAMARPASLSP